MVFIKTCRKMVLPAMLQNTLIFVFAVFSSFAELFGLFPDSDNSSSAIPKITHHILVGAHHAKLFFKQNIFL